MSNTSSLCVGGYTQAGTVCRNIRDTLNICECWTCWGLDLISLSNPSLLCKRISWGKGSPLSGMSALQVRATRGGILEAFYFGGGALDPVTKWMEDKAGNKEKAGINIASKIRNRNVFLKLRFIASCILAFRALGNKSSVWVRARSLINSERTSDMWLNAFLPKPKARIFAKGATCV